MLSFTKCGWSTQTTPKFIERITNCKTFYLHHSIFHRIAPFVNDRALNTHKLVAIKHEWFEDPYIYMHATTKDLKHLNISRVSIDEKKVTTPSCGVYTGDIEMFMGEEDHDVSWANSCVGNGGWKFELRKDPDSGHDVIYVMGQSWYKGHTGYVERY